MSSPASRGWGPASGRHRTRICFVGVSNAWLWIGERAGLPALGAALVAYLGVMWTVLRRPIRRELARPAGAALIAVLVASMVDHHIVSFPHLVMLVGLLPGRSRRRVHGPSARGLSVGVVL